MNQDKQPAKHIILIEDDESLAQLIVVELQQAGYRVQTVVDGKEGLALIRRSQPDLVLLDMMLPSMSGMEILEELHQDGSLPDLPIVIVSSSGQPVETEKAKKLGVRDYLVKVNFSPREVLAKVQATLRAELVNEADHRQGADDTAAKIHLLIVEDDSLLSEVLSRQFETSGYQVSTVTNAAAARRVLASNQINLILLDIKLPNMNGFDFLDELKRDDRLKNIPVIIISNLGQKEEIERGLKGGAVDYIVKADTFPEEIVKRVEKVLEK